jgi:uncharacterized membrane protein YtjA (UPF0391 family)
LTGFIAALFTGGISRQPARLFHQNRQISGLRGQEPSFRHWIILSVGAGRAVAVIARATANRGGAMLSWVVTFLVVALIAGILGFGGVAGVSIEIAKAIFFIAIVLFLVSAVVGLVRGRTNV